MRRTGQSGWASSGLAPVENYFDFQRLLKMKHRLKKRGTHCIRLLSQRRTFFVMLEEAKKIVYNSSGSPNKFKIRIRIFEIFLSQKIREIERASAVLS